MNEIEKTVEWCPEQKKLAVGATSSRDPIFQKRAASRAGRTLDGPWPWTTVPIPPGFSSMRITHGLHTSPEETVNGFAPPFVAFWMLNGQRFSSALPRENRGRTLLRSARDPTPRFP